MTAATDDTTSTSGDPTPDPQNDGTRAAQIAVEPPEPTGEGEDTEQNGPGREAARYRRQLRQAENERDALREQVESLQRAEVERIAATDGHLTRPGALWASGTALADLLGQDGTVDRDRVMDAVGAAVDRLGLSTSRAPRPDHSQGPRGGESSAQGWAQFLKINTR